MLYLTSSCIWKSQWLQFSQKSYVNNFVSIFRFLPLKPTRQKKQFSFLSDMTLNQTLLNNQLWCTLKKMIIKLPVCFWSTDIGKSQEISVREEKCLSVKRSTSVRGVWVTWWAQNFWSVPLLTKTSWKCCEYNVAIRYSISEVACSVIAFTNCFF